MLAKACRRWIRGKPAPKADAGEVCRRASASGGWTIGSAARLWRSAPARQGGLAGRRAPLVREREYYLPNLRPDTTRTRQASLNKARWVCNQAHQQLQEELDYFEGHSRRGLHRHGLLTLIVRLFLEHRRMQAATGVTRAGGPPPQPSLLTIRPMLLDHLAHAMPRARLTRD